jgi:hypothetical protein
MQFLLMKSSTPAEVDSRGNAKVRVDCAGGENGPAALFTASIHALEEMY